VGNAHDLATGGTGRGRDIASARELGDGEHMGVDDSDGTLEHARLTRRMSRNGMRFRAAQRAYAIEYTTKTEYGQGRNRHTGRLL